MTNILLINGFFNWVDEKSRHPYYPYYLTMVLVGLSLFFATPKFLFYHNHPELIAEPWNTFILKSNNLLDPLTQLDPNTHQAKLVFRLTMPILIKIFHLNYAGAYSIKFLIGILLLLQVYRLSYKLLTDSVSATFLTSGLAFLYFGRAGFIAFATFDGIAFFCAVLALLYQKPILVFLLSTVAAWLDERALMALPIILLFCQIGAGNPSSFEWKNLMKPTSSGLAVLAAIGAYIILRLFLTFQFGMLTPTASSDFSVFHQNVHLLGLAIWTFWEGFWLLYLLAALYALKNKYYLFLGAILTQTLVSGLIASCVGDVTRSGAYLVPLVFVFVIFLKNYLTAADLKSMLFICAVISFIFPAYYVATKKVDMYHPMYYDVVAFVLNRVI